MTRRAKAEQASGYTVLLVDDNADYLQATRLLLEREGHNVLTATNGPEALGILPQQKVDLLLLDYFMPGMTGEQVVAEVRKTDPFVQVILQTGYASEQPPRELLNRLDVQGYYDKTEGPEQLLLWTSVGLKASHTLQALLKNRRGIEFILDQTPELHGLQPVDDLASEILRQVAGLLSRVGVAEGASGFLATLDGGRELVVRAGTGVFGAGGKARDVLDVARLASIDIALQEVRVHVGAGWTIVPLLVGPLTVGVIYLDRPASGDQTLELLRVLANQSAVALKNAQLYEVATIDSLTGAYVEGYFDQALSRELAASMRGRHGVALVLIDVDDMKSINRAVGRVAGDQALRDLGAILRQATRAGDVVGRFDGDSFAIVLRDPRVVGPARLAARIQEMLEGHTVAGPLGESAFRVSIGFSLIEPLAFSEEPLRPIGAGYFGLVASTLRTMARGALKEAQDGGHGVRGAPPLVWPTESAAT